VFFRVPRRSAKTLKNTSRKHPKTGNRKPEEHRKLVLISPEAFPVGVKAFRVPGQFPGVLRDSSGRNRKAEIALQNVNYC
jgi:hypothetical protein